MENSECSVGEDVSLTPDATDDSCITQFIEIVPVHISRKDFPNTVQVNDEFTADIKREPEDPCEEYESSALNTVSSTANNGDWFERVDETQSHMKPDVASERKNSNQLMSHVADINSQSSINESSFEVKIEADNNDITEHDDKPTPHVCTVCKKQFMRNDMLMRHSKTHTGDVYSCNECEKCFLSQRALRQHMNFHRSKYKCTECGQCFKNGSNLEAHMRSHSGEDKPFACTVCSKRFTRAYSLLVHSRIHDGEKPYKCHMCDQAFCTSGNLNVHTRVHTGDKPYKCSLCDKSFCRSDSLQTHKVHVHSNTRSYLCFHCGKLFSTNVVLKRHLRTHTSAKPY